MADLCTDNRFELIEKYKQMLIDATNIEDDSQEMAVIDNILFRLWQMGWLDRLDAETVRRGHWEKVSNNEIPTLWECNKCGWRTDRTVLYSFCPCCGAKMESINTPTNTVYRIVTDK